MQRTSAMIAAELYAEQPDVTFDEVVTARKLKTRQHKLREMRFMLLPGSTRLNAWRASMVITVLLAVLSAPLEMAFSYSQLIYQFYWVSKLIDILFWLDMIISFNVATISHGRMETNRNVLAKNYAKSWLLPDFLINFPWDDVLQEHGKTRKIAKILKLPKVFRVTRLLRVADEEAQFFGTAANIGGLLLMGHYLACIWVGLLVDCTSELDAQQLCPDMLTVYLQGLSIGMASLAGSDSWTRYSFEQVSATEPWAFQWHAYYTGLCEVVAALSSLLGVILVGMLYSNLAHAMDRHHSHTRLFHARVSNLQAAAHQHAIPKELFGRIKRHYYYVWSCGSDTSKAILTDATLSLDLRRELAYCFYGHILKQVPFLELTDKHFLQQICEFVEIEIFAAQDRIICAGDVGTELYFVAVGEVEVVLPSGLIDRKGTVIKTLHEGSFFGELGLLFPDSKHKVDVFGSTAGWLLVVPRGTLEKFCTEELLETFRFVALERLRKHSEMATGVASDEVWWGLGIFTCRCLRSTVNA
ncbi:Kcnh5 [Symbiodinium natans]|uniref:Kcnh5 protein n=1 Tax=Symbiodinium natans TaxID=878477 RepID=A0A812UF04_9DINO|nr:Kcnh5 [Symbiodinium natans]